MNKSCGFELTWKERCPGLVGNSEIVVQELRVVIPVRSRHDIWEAFASLFLD